MLGSIKRVVVAGALVGASMLPAWVLPASAQVVYAHPPTLDFFSPYDESYGTSPSFQIRPDARGPAVRIVRTCQYPNGWNVTDFSRDVNGTPGGLEHACPELVRDGRARSRY